MRKTLGLVTIFLIFVSMFSSLGLHPVFASSSLHFICSTMNRGNGGSITFQGTTYSNGQSANPAGGDYSGTTGNPPAPTSDWFFYQWIVSYLGSRSWVDSQYSQTTTLHLRSETYLEADFYSPIHTNNPSSPITWGTKQRITGIANQYSGQSLTIAYCPQGNGMGPPNRNGVPPFGSGNNGYLWTSVTVSSGTWDTGYIYPTLPIGLGEQLPQTYDVYAIWGSGGTSEVDSNVVSFTLNPATPQMAAPTLTPGTIQQGQPVTITDEIFSAAFVNSNDLTGTLTVQAMKQGTSSWTDIASQSFSSNYGYSTKYGQYGDYYDLSTSWTPSETGVYNVRVIYNGNHYYLPISNPPSSPLNVGPSQHKLTVSSAHDSPSPGNGDSFWSDGQSVTCSVTDAIVDGNTLWTCTGWTGTGSVPSSGTLSHVTFPIYQDSTITWNWQGIPLYAVTIISGNGGTVSYSSAYPIGSGTVPSGQSTTVQAPSGAQISLNANHDPEHIFSVWTTSGSVSVLNPTSTSTTLTVNGNGAATANFASTLAVSISPAAATIQTDQSVPFTATASGGSGTYTDYTWYWTEYNSVNHGSYDSGSLITYTFVPPEAGSYGVYVVLTDSHSNIAQSSTSSVTVQVPPPPPTCSLQVLVFNKAPSNPLQGATARMISAPNGQNLLSGTTDSSGQYTFQNILTGSYTIQATALGYTTDSGSATILAGQMGQIQIILTSTLSASALTAVASGTIPLPVQFTGSASGGVSPYSYSWTFGDGSSSNQQNPSYTFQTAGSYVATLSVTDSQGNTATSSVTINAFAQVHFSESGLPNIPSASWSVTFNDQTETSSSPGNNIYAITFTEPNGGPYSFSVTPPTGYGVLPPSGSITVNGKDRIVGVSFSLLAPLLASASVSPRSGTVPLPVQFTGSASGGVSPYSYSWTFGDGSSSNQQNPSYIYSTTGTYMATLTVTDTMGNVAQSIAFLTISSVYSVSFVESGLSPGTSWSATFNGITRSSTTNMIVFSQPNGQYSYSINLVQGYTCSPSQGSLAISGANAIQYITFTSAPTHMITFSESGLASGITWSVTITNVGTQTATTPSSITFVASSGVYSYTLGPIAGYSPSPSSGTITVSGKNTNQIITYSKTSTNILIKSEYSGYFLENLPFISEFGVYAPLVNGASPVQVYGILDGIKHVFSNPAGPGGYYSLSVDMGSLTPGSSLSASAVYTDGTTLNQEYSINIIQTPSWLMSILTCARDKNVEKSTPGQWDNTYTLNVDAEFDLSKSFSQNIQLPDFAGGGKYSLLPSVDLTFSFCSSGTLDMTGEFTLDTSKSTGLQNLAFGPVEVTPHLTISASGEFSLQGDSITWLEGKLSIGAGVEGEYTPYSPIGVKFDVPGVGPVTFGITLTAKIKADFAVDLILGPALDASKEPVPPLEIALQSITGAITFGVGLQMTAGVGVFALVGGGELDFNFALEPTNPFISGVDVSGTVYVKVHVYCCDCTVWSETGKLYPPTDPDPGNFTLTPRYYNTSNYEELTWTNGDWNGTAVQNIYPFTSVSAASSGNNAYILYTTDNLSLEEQNGLCLNGLEFDSNQRNLLRLPMPPIAGEIFFDPVVASLSNGSLLAMWNSIPFTEVGNGTDPLSFDKIIPQYSCYDPNIQDWSPVTNLTDSGVATSYSLSSTLRDCYGLVLEGDSIFPSNQYLAEYNLSNHSKLLDIGIANVSNIISFNAPSQTAVLKLADGSYEVLNLTAHMPITIPSINGYNIVNVEQAINSSDSLGILYCSSTGNMLCIYNVSSNTVSFSMNIPQTPNYLTFAERGSGYQLIIADPSGITSYFIENDSAGTPLFYPLQNITSMGSTITDDGIIVYTTENYGNSTNPLLNLSLTFIPSTPEAHVTLNTPGLQTALNVVHYTQNGVPKTGSIIGNTFSDFADIGSNVTIDNPISVSATQRYMSKDPISFTIQSDDTFTVNHATQWYVTFDQTEVDTDFNGTVMTIDGVQYGRNGAAFWWNSGSNYNFSFASPLPVGSGAKEYDWTSTAGLTSSQSGSTTINGPGSVTGNYLTRVHDITVMCLNVSKVKLVEGDSVNVNVTVKNEGNFTETFNVTLYGKTLYGTAWPIYTFTGVTLAPGTTTTLTIDGLGFTQGLYTLSAYAWPVSGETHTSDNTYIGPTVLVAPRPFLGHAPYRRPIPI